MNWVERYCRHICYVLEQTLAKNWVEWRGGVLMAILRAGGSTQLIWRCYLLIWFFSSQYIGKFEFNKQTFREFNQYIIAMVGCLWTSKAFQEDTHHQGLGMSDELLNKTAVKEAKNSFNIVYHPALMGYSVEFLQQVGQVGVGQDLGFSWHYMFCLDCFSREVSLCRGWLVETTELSKAAVAFCVCVRLMAQFEESFFVCYESSWMYEQIWMWICTQDNFEI